MLSASHLVVVEAGDAGGPRGRERVPDDDVAALAALPRHRHHAAAAAHVRDIAAALGQALRRLSEIRLSEMG